MKSGPQRALQLCERFLQKVVNGDYDAAFNGVRPYFPVAEQRFQAIASETKEQIGMAQLQFGAVNGHAFVSGDTVQGAVLRYRFLQTFDRDLVYWEFVFYRAQGGWLVNAMGFDDEIRLLFED
jgi:hypothetical protein